MRAAKDYRIEFHHLERAHILGQASTIEHVRVHAMMLAWALRQRDTREIFGQGWASVPDHAPAAAIARTLSDM